MAHGADSQDPYAAWDKTLTPSAKSPFPAITPFEASYRFGWEGVAAGGAAVRIGEGPAGEKTIAASGGPNAWVAKLWKYHADYNGESGPSGETPSWFHMMEFVRKGEILSEAYCSENAVIFRHRLTTEVKPWSAAPLPGVRDLFSAMLFVRSQPLRVGDRLRLCVFPDESPYLVDLTVAGRENLTVLGGSVPALRFSIRIDSIELWGAGRGRLAPHKKFHSGRIWISDDGRRIPLRAEVDIFIGSVFAELVKLKPSP